MHRHAGGTRGRKAGEGAFQNAVKLSTHASLLRVCALSPVLASASPIRQQQTDRQQQHHLLPPLHRLGSRDWISNLVCVCVLLHRWRCQTCVSEAGQLGCAPQQRSSRGGQVVSWRGRECAQPCPRLQHSPSTHTDLETQQVSCSLPAGC